MAMNPDILSGNPCLAQLVTHLHEQSQFDILRRYTVGIAGIPGAGKSTLARLLVDSLNELEPGVAALVPLDGFHFTQKRLAMLQVVESKGSPQTFDVESYRQVLRTARWTFSPVLFPVYDRQLHEPVLRDEPAQRLGPGTRVIVTEGNYLLLTPEPWPALAEVIDEVWLLDTPVQSARRWILARHERGGKTRDEAVAHYQATDLNNIQTVMQQMRQPELRLRWATDENATDVIAVPNR